MGLPRDFESPAADHDESFEELVAARALGSLEPSAAALLQSHLAACARRRALLADYQTVAALLPLSVPEAPPAPQLKTRLLAEAQRSVSSPESRVRNDAGLRVRDSRRGSRPWRQRLAVALPLAALLLISIGLGWWNLMLQEQLRQQQARLQQQERFIAAVVGGGQIVALRGTDQAPGATGEVVQPASGPPLLVAHGLAELPPNQVYQVWIIAGGQPTGVGLLRSTGADPAILPLERDLAGAQVVALTIEPAGGSPAPTGPIVLAGNL